MLLFCDLGNTKISCGLFDNGNYVNIFSAKYPHNSAFQGFVSILNSTIYGANVETCIISSVVDELNPALEEAIIQVLHVNPLFISTDWDLGIKIQAHNPKAIGTDRIANVCAASKLYEQRPLIVVDSGSATTFDIIDKEGAFIGGLIFPGLYMQLNALSNNTSKLPELNLDMMDKVQTIINTDTKKAILSGVVNGHAQAIQGLIVKCERELRKKAFIVGTGGDAKLLDKYMRYKKFDSINSYLTLEGIRIIYERNMD